MIADLKAEERAEFFLDQIREARQQVLEIIDIIDKEIGEPDWIKIQNTPIGKVYIKLHHLECSLCW